MSASRFVLWRTLATEDPKQAGRETISERLVRIEAAAVALCEVERTRLAERGDEEDWNAMVRRECAQIRLIREERGSKTKRPKRFIARARRMPQDQISCEANHCDGAKSKTAPEESISSYISVLRKVRRNC